MDFFYRIFYACLRLRFLDVETNPGRWRPVPAVCRILCCNVRGLARNLNDLTVASLLVPGFGCWFRGMMRWARRMTACVRDDYKAFRQPQFECGCCEMLVLVCVV